MSGEQDIDHLLKIVIIGDSGVGKTNLLYRYTKGGFMAESRATIGVDFSAKSMKVGEAFVKTQFWDTAGQEKYRSITSAYYKNAIGAIVVYDITKKDSFNNVKNWLSEVKMHAESDLIAILIGNKIDLEEERQVTGEAGEAFAKENKVFFMEVSALSNADECVSKAFNLLIEEIIKKKESEQNFGAEVKPGQTGKGQKINTGKDQPKKKKGGCC